ncbi:MAG TPA: peptidase [Pirellulales bacterium]|nr:peptidase [Pirellulales bacterium]
MRQISRAWCILALAGIFIGPSAARAEKIYVNDGREMDGRFVRIEGVAVDPNNSGGAAAAKPILMCDDDLRRTMIPWRLVSKVDPSPPPRWETFKIPQPIAEDGLPVATIGPILRLTPFDDWGRRTFTMQTNNGPADVIQGLTTVTPLWSRVESLKSQAAKAYLWDMRIATSSIPRNLLTKILLKQVDPRNPDQRLKLVRFYMQAERFPDAEAELRQVIADFPALAGLDDQAKALRQLGADRVLSEVEVRHKAGQYGVAYGMLERFPSQGINGATLQAVREKIQAYRAAQQRRDATIGQLDAQLSLVKDSAIRKHLQPIRDEIAAELTLATLDRLAPFRRLADDATLLPEQKAALAVSGWLIGANDAVDNVQVALSLVETRRLVLDYLRNPLKLDRDAMLQAIGSQQSASPKFVAAILAHMKPPIDTPPQQEPGSYELTIHGLENEPDVTYLVQLPPEYDPHVKYPAIVTLQGAGTTPEQQISWWAGESRMPAAAEAGAANVRNANAPNQPPAAAAPAAAGAAAAQADPGPPIPDIHTMRLGQSTRQGYIVIAPGWIKPHQAQYQYSAREHAAVLDSLRDACRRFSIDTDRVFLSGHSMGADAAWDIALAHPDLWAGVIPIVATSGKYVAQYWPNAEHLSLYFISGELDSNRTANNSRDWDRYFSRPRGWDMTLVEYEGRGHEHFSDEIQRVFDWMGRKKRDFFPHDFSAVTMRSWDNYFWCLELQQMPPNCLVDPAAWPPARGTHPLHVEVKVNARNGVNVEVHGAKVAVWLTPEWVDFNLPVTVTVGGNRLGTRHVVKPSVSVMLEDARTRADRQHPFWAKVE